MSQDDPPGSDPTACPPPYRPFRSPASPEDCAGSHFLDRLLDRAFAGGAVLHCPAWRAFGIEHYTPASTPIAFNFRGHAPCGTLMIWLQT